jgi:hypothetical protein
MAGKKKSAKEESSDEEDEEDMLEEVDGKMLPTDKALKSWVKAYVRCFLTRQLLSMPWRPRPTNSASI